MQLPDWDDLRFFLALTDAGTLSGAATATGVRHTTVARRIASLETALGTRLFDRFPKGWSLTATGQDLLPHARRLRDDVDTLQRAASGHAALAGTVCISAPPAFATYVLAPRLTPALRALPGIDIDLRGEIRQADLTRREADIALRFKRPTAPGMAVRLLTEIPYGLYANEHYLAERTPAQWELLGYDALQGDTEQQQWLESIRAGRRYCLRSNDQAALAQAAAAGAGVAVLPQYLASQASGLVLITAQPCPVRRKLWMLMHEDVRHAAPVRAVADALAALFVPGQ
jgi:DNA-binding transcriptional LysR family regulator